MDHDALVFPPMDPAVFAAKYENWLKRTPKKFKRTSDFGRVAIRRIPKAQFLKRVRTEGNGRAAYLRSFPTAAMRKDFE